MRPTMHLRWKNTRQPKSDGYYGEKLRYEDVPVLQQFWEDNVLDTLKKGEATWDETVQLHGVWRDVGIV